MLIVKNERVYRIGEEMLDHILEGSGFKDIVEETNIKAQMLSDEISQDCISEMEFRLRVRMSKIEDEEFSQLYAKLHHMIWDQFKKETTGDLDDYLTDLKPEEVKHNVHGELGLAYDLDNDCMIDCKDCDDKSNEYLRWIDRAKELSKRDQSEVTQAEVNELINDYPEFAKEADQNNAEPQTNAYMMTPEGLVTMDEESFKELLESLDQSDVDPELLKALLEPVDQNHGFDDNLPNPTHHGTKSLN